MRSRRLVRFGIIGCGNMGAAHAEVIARHPHARLIAVCNRSPEPARRLALRFDVPAVCTDAGSFFGRSDLDAVVIATHHDSHTSLALAAAEAGKHALIEKPLALTVPECHRIALAFEKARLRAGVVFNWRFSPVVTEARRRIPHPSVLVGCMMDDRWPDDCWAQQPRVGGGNLTQGCHMIDLLCFLSGGRPVELSAQSAQVTHTDGDDPDQLVTSIRFDNGAIASWIQGDACSPTRGSKYQLSVFGAGRSVEMHARLKAATFRDGRRVEEMRRRGEEGLSIRISCFIEDLLAEREPRCGLWDGLIATLLTRRALRAARQGRAETVVWDRDRPVLNADETWIENPVRKRAAPRPEHIATSVGEGV